MKTMAMTLLLALAWGTAFGLVQAYSVAPIRAQWAGWTDTVSQTVTCCWDELDTTCYVEPFSDCACALGARA
jgi:hypothetical protein